MAKMIMTFQEDYLYYKFPVPHVKLEGLYPIGLFTKHAFDFNDGKTLNLVLLLLIYRK